MTWIFFVYFLLTLLVISHRLDSPFHQMYTQFFILFTQSFLANVSLLLTFHHSPPSFTRWVWAGQDKSLALLCPREVRRVNPSRFFKFQLWYPEGSTQSPITKADTIRTSDLELSSVRLLKGRGMFSRFRGLVWFTCENLCCHFLSLSSWSNQYLNIGHGCNNYVKHERNCLLGQTHTELLLDATLYLSPPRPAQTDRS